MHSTVKDKVSASGLTRTSDFLSATVAKSIKICILGLTRMIKSDTSTIKNSAPMLPKKGMISATNPKLARKRSLLATIMFTMLSLLFKPKIFHIFGKNSYLRTHDADVT